MVPLALGTPPIMWGTGKEVLSDGGTTITWTISTNGNEDGGIDFPNTAERVKR